MINNRWIKLYATINAIDLFQGDIVSNVDISGQNNIEINNCKWKHSLSMSIKYAVIISHSCDVTMQNAGKRPNIIISELRPLSLQHKNYILTSSDIKDIESINKVSPDKNFVINLFYFKGDTKIENQEYIVDFNKIHCIESNFIKIDNKVLELTSEYRDLFRNKIGLHFARKG
jgi:hypothetical protein